MVEAFSNSYIMFACEEIIVFYGIGWSQNHKNFNKKLNEHDCNEFGHNLESCSDFTVMGIRSFVNDPSAQSLMT